MTEDDDLLTVELTHLDGVAILALRGEIDISTAPLLQISVDRIRELGVPVVLDMDLVTFIDSSGVGALINVSGVAAGFDGSVQIRRPSDEVRRVLSLTGLDKLFLLEPGTD